MVYALPVTQIKEAEMSTESTTTESLLSAQYRVDITDDEKTQADCEEPINDLPREGMIVNEVGA